MTELVAVLAIMFCLVVIGFLFKIYKESPRYKDEPEDE